MFTNKELAELRDYFNELKGDKEESSIMKYSGRAMYGRYCVGIVCPNPFYAVTNLLGYFAEKAIEAERHSDPDAEEFTEERQLYDKLFQVLTSDVRSDNMGYDTVVYFPEWEWDSELKVDEEVNEDTDEDED